MYLTPIQIITIGRWAVFETAKGCAGRDPRAAFIFDTVMSLSTREGTWYNLLVGGTRRARNKMSPSSFRFGLALTAEDLKAIFGSSCPLWSVDGTGWSLTWSEVFFYDVVGRELTRVRA